MTTCIRLIILESRLDFDHEAKLLSRVPLFSKLDASRLKLLAFTSERIAYEPGEVVFYVGDLADDAYLIMQGCVEILAEEEERTWVSGVLQVNELCGELGIINNHVRTATLRAHDDVEMLRIKGDVFLNLLKDDAELTLDVLRQTSNKLIRAHEAYVQLNAQQASAGDQPKL